MNPQTCAPPTFRALGAAWLAFTWRVANAFAASAQRKFDDSADAFRDSCLDVGSGATEEPTAAVLPALDPDEYVASLRGRVEEVLREAASLLNEDGSGNWAAVTEERVSGLFAELADEALAVALDLRVAQAEAQLPAHQSHGVWARKYRRLLAQSGHWPPTRGY